VQSYSNTALFHDLLFRSYLYHCVWSVIIAHNLTPEKRDNNCSLLWVPVSILEHALVLQLVGLVPHSSVSLLLGFSAMLSVSLVSRVTARSLQHGLQLTMARYTRIINCRPCYNLYVTVLTFMFPQVSTTLCPQKTSPSPSMF